MIPTRRFSAVQMQTSTPQKSTGRQSEFPNGGDDESLSTIREHSLSEGELLVDVEDENLETDISIAVNRYDEILQCRPNRMGIYWDAFKPIKNDSLFAKVVNNVQAMKDVVESFLDTYEENPKEFTMNLLQFVADVAGFQKIDINDYYDYNKKNFSECLTNLEDKVNDIFKRPFCLMENDTMIARYIKYAGFHFIHNLIVNAHVRGILYEDPFTKHFIPFLRHFSLGAIRPTKMTSVILGLKILSSLTHCYASVKCDRENEMLVGDALRQLMNYLYQMFKTTSHLYPVKDHIVYMREVASSELMIWLVNAPDIFFKEHQAFSHYVKFIKDPDAKVRLITLKILERLLNFNKLENYFRGILEKLVSAIEEMFKDPNSRIEKAAFRCYYIILSRFSEVAHTDKIIYLLYCQNYEIANEAAKVLVKFWAIFASHNIKYNIKKMSEIAAIPKYSDYTEALVEIFFNHIKELTDWAMIVDFIENEKRNSQLRNATIDIFLKSANFVLTDGKTKLNRKAPPQTIPEIDKKNLIDFLITNFTTLTNLMQEFSCELIHLFVKIDPNYLNMKPVNELKLLLKNIQEMFSNETEKEYFSAVFQFMKKLQVNVPALEKDVSGFITEVYLFNISSVNPANLKELSKDECEVALKKISALVDYVVPQEIKYPSNWPKILNVFEGKINQEMFINFLNCISKHMIWKLENMLAEDMLEDETAIDEFNSERKRFLKVIFSTFRSITNVDVKNELVKIFLEFSCEFHKTVYAERINPEKRAALDFNLIECEEALDAFIRKRVIEMNKNKLSLEKRRYLVHKFVNMILFGKFKFERLCSVFKYYLSHNELFGPFIDAIINELEVLPIAKAMEMTLLKLFQSYLKLDETDPNADTQFKNLNNLATKFQSHKKLNSNLAALVLLYAFPDIKKENCPKLLTVISCFLQNLNEDDKKKVVTSFNKYFANSRSEDVKQFKSCLLKEKRKASSPPKTGNEAKKSRRGLNTRTLSSKIEEVQDTELQTEKRDKSSKNMKVSDVQTERKSLNDENNKGSEENDLGSPILVRKTVKIHQLK